jgi:hypothetical protein
MTFCACEWFASFDGMPAQVCEKLRDTLKTPVPHTNNTGLRTESFKKSDFFACLKAQWRGKFSFDPLCFHC